MLIYSKGKSVTRNEVPGNTYRHFFVTLSFLGFFSISNF